MADPDHRNPTNWDDYQYGSSPRQGSVGSDASRVHFDDHEVPESSSQPLHIPRHGQSDGAADNDLRRRRSSMSMRIGSITQAGGVNSIENFARSWQRAAGFYEITSHPQSFVVSEDADDTSGEFPRMDEEHGELRTSLLRRQFEQAPGSEEAVHDESPEFEAVDHGSPERRALLSAAPHLATHIGASYGASYDTFASRVNEASMRHAGRLFLEQQAAGAQDPDKDRPSLLVKQVEREDGKLVNVVVGQSTLPQTVFNAVNILIGVGLLSLPLGVLYAGWLVGMLFLFFSALVTNYTARILAKCLDVDRSLITFADIAYVSFGSKARVATSVLFSVELIAACVALVVLFADSLDALIPGWGLTSWKILCGIALVPLSFTPLRFLSFSSILGIISCFGIVSIVFVDGLLKPHAPGSLREPAKTYLFPASWSTLPLSFGLLMSPWGGHSVFPNIYRDMRHPQKYNKGLTITYIFTYLLDVSMAVAGLLMFGDEVRNEVTSNILLTKGYPKALSVCITVFVGIIPLTKIPLNARPIISTVEVLAGLDPRAMSDSQALVGMSAYSRGLLKFLVRVLTTILFVVLAIVFPDFDRIMALLGSAMCFSICVILPLAFHLKLFGQDIGRGERVLNWALIVVCSIMATVGTVALKNFDTDIYTFRPQVTIQDIFHAVQSGLVTRGIVPFENSTNGSVVFTLDLFADHHGACPDICVVGEVYLDIHHFLLGHDRGESLDEAGTELGTKPLRSVQHVKRLYSHPQAFGQCELFLSGYLKGVERHEVSSTSKAAEIVARDASGASAAIASEMAARAQKLTVLAEGIEDREDNTTRFLILRNTSKGNCEDVTGVPMPKEHQKTLVSFTIDHRSPGALADALTVFKTHSLNLTSINSRPSRLEPWHYIFFVEFHGSRTVDPDGTVGRALTDLEGVAKAWRWLGSWPDELRHGKGAV
ncbi:MAG: hypothetical protein M1832_004727 [Thelocarpon impressellum]|nr:MAG: hypothetical protein M1832_004727 [Thelocarpon impressellum]